jgi:hypothetical protein
MADKEDEKTRGNEGKQPEVEVLPPKGQRVGQKPKPVMPIGAAGPAPAELNPGSSSTASLAEAPDTEEKP